MFASDKTLSYVNATFALLVEMKPSTGLYTVGIAVLNRYHLLPITEPFSELGRPIVLPFFDNWSSKVRFGGRSAYGNRTRVIIM